MFSSSAANSCAISADQRAQRLALLVVAQAVDGGQQRIEAFGGQRLMPSPPDDRAARDRASAARPAGPRRRCTRMREASSRICSDAAVCAGGAVPP